MRAALFLLGGLAVATPAVAQPVSDPLSPLSAPAQTVPSPVAQPLLQVSAPPPVSVRVPKDWRGVFDAIDAGDWSSAQAGIAMLPPSVLTPVAKAELYTAKNSPPVDLGSLQALIAQAPELPEANQLALMALKRGATTPPLVIPEKPTVVLGSAPVRYRAKPVLGEPAADQLRSALDPLIKADDASGAEALLASQGPALSAEARAEAATRVAFIYYVLGLDMDARRVADTWRPGATGFPRSASAGPSPSRSNRLGFARLTCWRAISA